MADGDEDAPGDKAPAQAQSGTYDQAFFLALAAKGKDAWNEWRHIPANKDVRVTFARNNFSESPWDEIDLSGFEFGDHADFSGCKWRGGEWQEIEDPEAFVPGRASFVGAALGHEAKFTGANFGVQANFTRATFRHGADFIHAVFGYAATFAGAAFGHRANFAGVNFGLRAKFTGATFADEANFTGATFGDAAHFTNVIFGNGARFKGAGFAGMAYFTSATFGGYATFTGAAFGLLANFDNAHFKGIVDFTGKSPAQWARDIARADGMDDEVRAALEKRHRESWELNGSGPEHFSITSFANTRFDRSADFSSRTFGRITDFTGTRFYMPPIFDASLIDFAGAHVGFAPRGKLLHCTKSSRIPLQLRAFRKIAEETKNHDLERDLYIEERKAERGVYWRQLLDELKKAPEELKKKLEDVDEQQREVWSNWRHRARARNAHVLGIAVKFAQLIFHLLWIAVMFLYWAFSNYGRNFVLPAAWLCLSVPLFDWRYTEVLARLMAKAPDVDKYKQAVGMLALGNAVPFVGPLTIDAKIKEFLFCPDNPASCVPPIPPEGFQCLVIAQNLVSIILVFFIGLALRNYFRIK